MSSNFVDLIIHLILLKYWYPRCPVSYLTCIANWSSTHLPTKIWNHFIIKQILAELFFEINYCPFILERKRRDKGGRETIISQEGKNFKYKDIKLIIAYSRYIW